MSSDRPDGVRELLWRTDAGAAAAGASTASRVRCGNNALAASLGDLRQWVTGRSLFVVTSDEIWSLHGTALEPLLGAAGSAEVLTVEDGEAAKTVEGVAELWRRMLAGGGKRDSRVVAFGGGTVGDLAGFAAGCFLRGIHFAQIPTTLLAQVDAALGGKTGINLPSAKNSVGVFHSPDWVISDSRFLATLEAGEIRSGLVEVVKMAALLDLELLGAVEDRLDSLLAGDGVALGPVVAAAAAAKLGVVERDPYEEDERRLLNFGHTLGHALEAVSGYGGLRHGEAVAYGILFALRLAGTRGMPTEDAERLRRILHRFGLPPLTTVMAKAMATGEAPGGKAATIEALMTFMGRDKKARGSGLVWVLPERLGLGRSVSGIGLDEVRYQLSLFLADPWARA